MYKLGPEGVSVPEAELKTIREGGNRISNKPKTQPALLDWTTDRRPSDLVNTAPIDIGTPIETGHALVKGMHHTLGRLDGFIKASRQPKAR